jgi:hypothetical protein
MAHVTFCINLLALQFWDSKVQIIILLFMEKKKNQYFKQSSNLGF